MAAKKPEDGETKTREKRTFKYDPLIQEIRKVVPCNRTTLANLAIDKYVDSFRNAEGALDANAVSEIIEVVKSSRGVRALEEVKGVEGV